jgi:TGF-beta receptor
MNHTLLLSEVNATSNHLTPLSFMQTDSNNHDWEKMDIVTSVKMWTENRQLQHLIRLACDDCKSELLPITLHHDFKPFIVIDTKPQKSITRKKRSINCSPGTNECCRDSLYIDFAAIGWDDWILSPKGYHAYFCHGACSGVASITRTKGEHAAVFNRLMHTSRDNKKKLEMIPCCTGTSYSSLEIIRLDSNNTAAKEVLPNMVLDSCGCS